MSKFNLKSNKENLSQGYFLYTMKLAEFMKSLVDIEIWMYMTQRVAMVLYSVFDDNVKKFGQNKRPSISCS